MAGAGRVLTEEAENRARRPHVVILGAGASRAACPKGDKNGKTLPLMNDLAEVVGMKGMLEERGIDCGRNFEEVFSDLYAKNETNTINLIQYMIESYFLELKLPDEPTLYDHLFLSLGENDIIATFNWDPLLPLAMGRSRNAGLSAPVVSFLHGNVAIGYCEQDKTYGDSGRTCSKCGQVYKNTPLLYPIKQKNYHRDPFIKSGWEIFRQRLEYASMLTIFGYSAPKTDVEAFEIMRDAWQRNDLHDITEVTFIVGQGQTVDEVDEAWEPVIGSNHCRVHHDFYESSIADYPRRTGEAFYEQSICGRCAKKNPIPRDVELAKFHKWISCV